MEIESISNGHKETKALQTILRQPGRLKQGNPTLMLENIIKPLAYNAMTTSHEVNELMK
jgi:hypothetical protein